MQTVFLSLLFIPQYLVALVLASEDVILPRQATTNITQTQNSQCNKTALWEQSFAHYQANNVTNLTRAWWNKEAKSGRSFVNALSSDFGDHVRGFDCGIGKAGTCLTPSCDDYLDEPETVWAYDARAAIVNMNYALNAIHNGITNGQLNYIGLIQDIINTFTEKESDNFDSRILGAWLTAGVGALFAAFPPSRPLSAALALLGGGFQTLGLKLEKIENDLDDISLLGQFASNYGEKTRDAIENWAAELFNGTKDAAGNDIIDYLPVYAESVAYDYHDAESFIKTSMIARTVNEQWRNNTLSYIMCSNWNSFLANSSDAENRHPSTYIYNNEALCSFYTIDSSANLTKLPGYDALTEGNAYGVQKMDITESSFAAYRVAKFDYNQNVTMERMKQSLKLPVMDQPASKKAAWEGVFDMPVCHVGLNVNWMYRDDRRYKFFHPCCCGNACEETKDFVYASRLVGNDAYLSRCKEQYPGFADVDYGFTFSPKKPKFSPGQIAGISIGSIIGVGILLCLCNGGGKDNSGPVGRQPPGCPSGACGHVGCSYR